MSSVYTPPKGSQIFPNPRTAADILLRTGGIHIFAACAYFHLLTTLDRRWLERPWLNQLLLLLFFVLVPEFILLQLGFWLARILLTKRWREPSRRRFVEMARDFEAHGVQRLVVILVLATLYSSPLVVVVLAYRNRLGIRYHEAIYVGNLGLDHRNGWLSVAGLVASGLNFVLVVASFLLSRFSAGVGDDEGGNVESDDSRNPKEKIQGADPRPINLEFDWLFLPELFTAALIHQFLLSRTNHPVPVAMYAKSVPLLLVSAVAAAFLYRKRGVHLEVIARYFAVAFVAATIVSQLGWDLWELYDVTHGRVQEYNYRWGAKDWFSAKGSESN